MEKVLAPAQADYIFVPIMGNIIEQIGVGLELVLADAAHLVLGVDLHQDKLE